MNVVIYHMGDIGFAIARRCESEGWSCVDYNDWQCDSPITHPVDVFICTSGKMAIAHPESMVRSPVILDRMVALNYSLPRVVTEMALNAGAKLIIHIGSNSARYGKGGAEDYAALKVALWKYCELRGSRAWQENGARICCINLGGVVNSFWDHVKGSAEFNLEIAEREKMIPEPCKGLTSAEVAELVVALIKLPANIAVKDLLVVGAAYQ